MATVTLNDTPTAQIIAKAAAEFEIRDSVGRKITLKKPPVLAQFRIVEVVGDSAGNETYMRMILPLIYVTGIDDAPVFQPTSKVELEGLIGRLDEHGIVAVAKGVHEHFGMCDPQEDNKALKKPRRATRLGNVCGSLNTGCRSIRLFCSTTSLAGPGALSALSRRGERSTGREWSSRKCNEGVRKLGRVRASPHESGGGG